MYNCIHKNERILIEMSNARTKWRCNRAVRSGVQYIEYTDVMWMAVCAICADAMANIDVCTGDGRRVWQPSNVNRIVSARRMSLHAVAVVTICWFFFLITVINVYLHCSFRIPVFYLVLYWILWLEHVWTKMNQHFAMGISPMMQQISPQQSHMMAMNQGMGMGHLGMIGPPMSMVHPGMAQQLPPPQQPSEKLDNISKVKSLIGPLRESLSVSTKTRNETLNQFINFAFFAIQRTQ